MKQATLYLIICICITGGLSSCENEIPYKTGFKEPQLIMNALLDAGKAENFVYLSLSGAESIGHVEEASVTLSINGKQVEALEECPPLKPLGSLDQDPNNWLNFLPEIGKRKEFRMRTALQPGDVVRLDAIAENGKYHAWTEATVPHPVNPIRVDTTRTALREYSGWKTYRQFKITLQDRPGEKNYYRLDIRHDITTYAQDFGERDTIIQTRLTDLINREDIVLTDGNPMTDEDEDDIFGTYIANKYNVFSDGRFANANCTLKVYTNLYDGYQPAYIYHVNRNCRTITVRLLSITEAEYRYLKALNCLESDNYEEALMKPVIIPNNVKGGLGFVGISSEARVVMQLPDEIINWDDLLPYTQAKSPQR
ncbi:MAG: DUF4249 domain-containing protein [Bacteroides sp.]|nr:DUF4249 domain-containing protein [Bacteroides sp.]